LLFIYAEEQRREHCNLLLDVTPERVLLEGDRVEWQFHFRGPRPDEERLSPLLAYSVLQRESAPVPSFALA
jgi:hypothetical protein